jgi:hypothetical protein
MPTTVKGIYHDGRIELSEDPGVTGEAAVMVTFLDEAQKSSRSQPPRIMTSGMLAVPGRRMSTEDDFKIAEPTANTPN